MHPFHQTVAFNK